MKIKKTILNETVSQTAGPFVHIGCTPNLIGINNIFKSDLGSKTFKNLERKNKINISGSVFDGNNKALLDVMIETWQCNEKGIYSSEEGFGRITSNCISGKYSLNTLKPGFNKNYDGMIQSPHIMFILFARGINTPLITRMYFNKIELKKDTKIYSRVKNKNKESLIAKKIDLNSYLFDIYLQGDKETIFFDF